MWVVPGKRMRRGWLIRSIVGSCDRWINAPNGTCPKVYPKNFTMLMARKASESAEGGAENISSVGASDKDTADDNSEQSEYAGSDVTGEPDEDAVADAVQRAIARTAHGQTSQETYCAIDTRG